MPGRYRELFARPHVVPLLGAGIVARLPLSMYALAMLLVVRERTGSYAAAGAVVGAASVGYAVCGPAVGRLLDRFGQTRPLVAAAVVNGCAFAVLIGCVLAGAGVGVLAAVAFGVGASVPPVAASQRALWRTVLAGGALETALAVDAMLLDVFLIVGPLLVTAVAALADSVVALAGAAAMFCVGTLWFAALGPSRAWRGTPRGVGLLGPLRAPGIRTLVVTIGLTGAGLGVLRVGLVGYAGARGAVDLGGLLFTALGVGSLAGGLVYGGRSWRWPVEQRYQVLLALLALGILPLTLGGPLWVGGLLAVVSGVALAPVVICEFQLVGSCAPQGVVTEAYAWSITATFAGGAAGNALGGGLVDALGWEVTLLAAAGCVGLAGAVATAWRDTFRAPDAVAVG